MDTKRKTEMRERRHRRVRAKVRGTAARPRFAVFKSNRYVYAELIDDTSGRTLASALSRGRREKTLRERARGVGRDLAKRAVEQGVSAVVFDRGGFLYAGVIKEVADGARDGGLNL